MSTLDMEDKITVQFMVIQRHDDMINEPIQKVFADLVAKQGSIPRYGGDYKGGQYALCVQEDFDVESWCQDIQYKLLHLEKEIVDSQLFSIYYKVGYCLYEYKLVRVKVYSPTSRKFLGYAPDLADLKPILK